MLEIYSLQGYCVHIFESKAIFIALEEEIC